MRKNMQKDGVFGGMTQGAAGSGMNTQHLALQLRKVGIC
jgi:hypothetical protein